jgi:hypothetical protein
MALWHVKRKWMLLLLIFLALVVCASLLMHLLYGIGFEVLGLVKPVTIFQYSGFLLFAVGINYYRNIFVKMPKEFLDLLIIIAFFCVMATGFEVIWSFFFWFSTFINTYTTSTVVLDALTYVPANTSLYTDFSLNFSAKKNFLLLMISVYSVYFLHLIRTEKMHQKG